MGITATVIAAVVLVIVLGLVALKLTGRQNLVTGGLMTVLQAVAGLGFAVWLWLSRRRRKQARAQARERQQAAAAEQASVDQLDRLTPARREAAERARTHAERAEQIANTGKPEKENQDARTLKQRFNDR